MKVFLTALNVNKKLQHLKNINSELTIIRFHEKLNELIFFQWNIHFSPGIFITDIC